MPLNDQVSSLLAALAAFPAPDYATITAGQLRAMNDRPMLGGVPPEMATVRDLTIELPGRTLDARLYVPLSAGERPALTVFFHGGGWVIGTLETHDATCRALARASGSAFLAVAYRLAPEHPFPLPLEDCYEAICWATAHHEDLGVDATRLAVAGDSAGGNLAAAATILARDRHGPALRHQLLLYPVTDNDFSRPSYGENGSGAYFLSTAMMQWFWTQYLDPAAAGDPALAAIAQNQDLKRLPAATVIVAEFDPLRDEGLAYADGLRAAGVAVETSVAPGMIHGFASMFEAVPDALPWIQQAGEALRRSQALVSEKVA